MVTVIQQKFTVLTLCQLWQPCWCLPKTCTGSLTCLILQRLRGTERLSNLPQITEMVSRGPTSISFYFLSAAFLCPVSVRLHIKSLAGTDLSLIPASIK
jgi:hypothetical protein